MKKESYFYLLPLSLFHAGIIIIIDSDVHMSTNIGKGNNRLERVTVMESSLSESRNSSSIKFEVQFKRKPQHRLKVWKISIMGINAVPDANRENGTSPLTNLDQLPVPTSILKKFRRFQRIRKQENSEILESKD